MARYIDADKLKAHYSWWECTESGNEQKKVFDTIIDLQPTADVVERKKAHWEIADQEEPRFYGCSRCLKLSRYEHRFCPNCGAQMDERKEDGA